ncbi:MAG: hypothetical protein KDN22_30020 [Verrucomicrobiae bacterium]|nr:hypothetical protein [Verrucomicrobiae bacterium]
MSLFLTRAGKAGENEPRFHDDGRVHLPHPFGETAVRDGAVALNSRFPIALPGAYLTKDSILEIYDQMLQARRTGQPWQSPLDPHPGPPADTEGNFLPFSDWGDNYPAHIHPKRELSTSDGAE